MHKLFCLFNVFCLLQLGLYAQRIPDIALTDLDGNIFQTQKINEITDKPVVLAFWATWCIPCINELSTINENMEEWKASTKFDFYAISEDDSRTVKKVLPLVKGKGWDFPVFLDKNQVLKRELNVANVPYTMVIKKGKIIYRRNGYVAGNEEDLYKVIRENQ